MLNIFKDKRVGVRAAIIAAIAAIIGSVALVVAAIISKPSKPENNVSKELKHADIHLTQFALNEDSCYYKIDTLNHITPLDLHVLNPKKRKKNQKFNPLIDITFINSGEEDAVFTKINMIITDYELWQGDGQENPTSNTIEVLQKYKITIPNLYNFFYDKNGTKKSASYLISKSILPPVLIKSSSPARVQIEIKKTEIMMGTYKISLEFLFSNSQSIVEEFTIDF